MRLRYFYETLDLSYTEKLDNPPAWMAYCAGRVRESRTRTGARIWIVRHSWRIAGDDVRLARVLRIGDRDG